MKTKWDCLFALFELKEARLTDIAKRAGSSTSTTRQRLVELLKSGLIVQKEKIYSPNKEDSRTWAIFNIMKFCRSKSINYNLFLSKELARIIQIGMENEEVRLADFKEFSYITARKYLTCLSRTNLIFVTSKKPLKFKFVFHTVFEDIMSVSGLILKPKRGPKTPIPESEYAEIEKLLSKLRELKNNVDFASEEEEQKIEFTSASTQLEGNTFTLEESKELILHDIVPPQKKLSEANEVKNYYAAISHMLKRLDEPISISFILDLHRIVVFNLGVKEGIRASDVSIKGNPFYKVSHFGEIYQKLDALCSQINAFMEKKSGIKETSEFASFVHNEFQHIHPFEDGNSRVTRLIWNYILMKNDFPLINIYSNARDEYLSITKLARERDDGKLNIFLVKIIKDNLYKLARF